MTNPGISAVQLSTSSAIDLRSDTVTRPTDAMWDAMRAATLLDDTLEGDPTVEALENEAARAVGMEAALFVCSGTMGNAIATLVHAPRGGEALVDVHAHIANSEGGGISRLAGLFCRTIASSEGEMDLEQLDARARGGFSRYGEPTAMIALETTHNASGGYVPSLGYMRQVTTLAADRGIAVHIDGARLFNAAVALDISAKELCEGADSVSFCLSKGLSAPMGAILAGSTEFVQKARTLRRTVGGGLRQAGIMAAAGRIALRDMPARLRDDHANAQRFWQALDGATHVQRDPSPPQSNIVRVHVPDGNAQRYCEALAQAGVLVRAAGAHAIRVVTHRHIDEAGINGASEAFCRL